MLEPARRVLLALCLLGGCWLFWLTDATPLFVITAQEGPTGCPPGATTVSGPAWEAFLAKARAVSLGGEADKAWRRRLPPSSRDSSPPWPLYFKPYEAPVAELSLPREGAWSALCLQDAPGPALRLGQAAIRDENFRLGPGLTADLPPSLAYPWRKMGWKLWVGGWLLYVFLPWPQPAERNPNVPRRQVVVRDMLCFAVAGIFFSLPLALTGGSVQSLTLWGWLPLVCWPVAGLALARMPFTLETRRGARPGSPDPAPPKEPTP